jgi:hypothetical protein
MALVPIGVGFASSILYMIRDISVILRVLGE